MNVADTTTYHSALSHIDMQRGHTMTINDIISALPDALAKPFLSAQKNRLITELVSEAMEYAHEENMAKIHLIESMVNNGLILPEQVPLYMQYIIQPQFVIDSRHLYLT